VRRVVAPLIVSGALLALAVQPAGASSVNSAYAASASGLVNVPPKVLSTYPGNPSSTGRVLLGGSEAALTIRSGQTSVTSTSATASALPATLSLSPQTLLSVSLASSHCENTAPGVVTGTSRFQAGALDLFGVPIPIGETEAPNTVIGLPGIATITLNRQRTAADGSLTVQAVYVELFNDAETMDMAAVTCNTHAV
jgi:hypothetical protein